MEWVRHFLLERTATVADRCLQIIADAAELSDAERDHVVQELQAMKDDPDLQAKAQARAEEWSKQAAQTARQAEFRIASQEGFKAFYARAKESPNTAKLKPVEIARAYLVGSTKRFFGARKSAYYMMKSSGENAYNRATIDLLKEFGRKVPMLANDETFNRQIAYELGGVDTGNKSAKQFAEILRRELDSGVDAANTAGANIEKLGDYIMNQSRAHDPYKIARFSKGNPEAWIDAELPRLKEETFAGQEPREFLRQVYHNILQGGREMEDDGVQGAVGLAKRMSRHRVLQYKSPEAFLESHQQFGNGTVINNVLQQIMRMHSQAVLLERTGGNPSAFGDFMVRHVANESRAADKVFTPADADSIRSDVKALTGGSPVHSWMLHHWFQVFRESLNMIHLGSSTFSSLGDTANMAMNLKFNGMGALEAEGTAFKQFTKFMTYQNGLLDKDKMLLARSIGGGYDGVLHAMAGRFDPMGDYTGTASRVMGKYFKWTRQAGWDDFFKYGTAKALMSLYGGVRKVPFDKLESSLKQGLELAGIDSDGWDKMRASEPVVVDGVDHLTPDKIKDDALSLAYTAHLLSTGEDTVPLPGARQQQAMMQYEYKRGTWRGELLHLMMMYKSFPVSQAMRMWPKIVQMGAPGIALAIPSYMMMGYLSMSIKNLLTGQLPPDPRKFATYAESLIQSGGASMLGDLLERKFGYGYTLADFVAGPAVSDIGALISPFSEAGHAKTAATAQKAGEQELEVLSKMNPLANMWFTKGAYHYAVTNEIQEAMNPGYIQREAERQKQNYDVNYWLDPEKVHQELHK